MAVTKFSISWIYGEFRLARVRRGFTLERWTAPFPVHNLEDLNRALLGASEHMDLSRGGEVTITYEHDLHTHEFFTVPNMSKTDLEKSLARKVLQNKPFEDKAAWCYHEARHNDHEEGILLHIMPQHVVDAIVRLCQKFYLTPRQLVPLTEVVSSITESYRAKDDDILVLTALFKQRTEIVVTCGNGEVLFVRELPYNGNESNQQRLITDINRTIHYTRQKLRKSVAATWLIGEGAEQITEQIGAQIEEELHFDPNGLDPFYWACEVSKLKGQRSANFIPLMAQKKIDRTLFYRVALWVMLVTSVATGTIISGVEYMLTKQTIDSKAVTANIAMLTRERNKIEGLLARRMREQEKLNTLQSHAHYLLPIFFVNHLGDIMPAGLTVTNLSVLSVDAKWEIQLKGQSKLSLNHLTSDLLHLESLMKSPPWNITITKSWKSTWYQQLQAGAALSTQPLAFEITGTMK